MAGSQKPKHVATTGGAWHTAGCNATVKAQGHGGKGDSGDKQGQDKFTSKRTKVLWAREI